MIARECVRDYIKPINIYTRKTNENTRIQIKYVGNNFFWNNLNSSSVEKSIVADMMEYWTVYAIV